MTSRKTTARVMRCGIVRGLASELRGLHISLVAVVAVPDSDKKEISGPE
jgi:hypothetical protein